MIDVRFPTALQIMLSLALAEAEGVAQLSSSQLADGVGANPSFVRKLLLPLADAGLVHSTFGRGGGTRLGRLANLITLRDIYRAAMGEKSLWTPREVPHQCLVSSNVESFFVKLSAEADDAVMRALEHRTLADSLAELRVMHAAQ
ncbi:Rrf2 family transcriptional regulator [Pseudomonas sp. NA-150]|uniref:Rrf2 family transcriptional regulator n=1 Tax=Pseudomonas sp. NA-150 TaxID=3367525 RepID=UPI0037C5F8C9